MTSFPTATIATSMSLLCAIMAPAVLASPEFVNGLALDGAMLDRSGGTTPNTGRVGYFSDIYYNPQRNQWWGLSDRGPGGGFLSYDTRVQRFHLKVDKKTGAISDFKILKTIILKDENGNPLNGMAPSSTNVLGNRFDPEGFVINPHTHNFYVSDEYGPSLYEFNDKGIRVRTFATTMPGCRTLPVTPVTPRASGPTEDSKVSRLAPTGAMSMPCCKVPCSKKAPATECATGSSNSARRPAPRSLSTPTKWKAPVKDEAFLRCSH
jgi:hypothetical protein